MKNDNTPPHHAHAGHDRTRWPTALQFPARELRPGRHPMNDLRTLPIQRIFQRRNSRPRSSAALDALSESIDAVGLLAPITVRSRDSGYEVLAGAHRLQACELLGHTEISCVVLDVDDLRAELATIDENLIRTELSPSERAMQTARRKAIYETLHPQTKAFVAGAHGSNAA